MFACKLGRILELSVKYIGRLGCIGFMFTNI